MVCGPFAAHCIPFDILTAMSSSALFRIGLSADFLQPDGTPAFPDIGLSLLENRPGIHHEFLPEYHPEYAPHQLAGYDVLISLKPRVTAASLEGITSLAAIGRCGEHAARKLPLADTTMWICGLAPTATSRCTSRRREWSARWPNRLC